MATPLPVPIRTPMHDANGNITRTWQLYWQEQARAALNSDTEVSVNGVSVTY